MEQGEMAVKSKVKESAPKKAEVVKIDEKEEAPVSFEAYGVTFTLDNSLKRFANDPFFVKKTEKVNAHFAKAKS